MSSSHTTADSCLTELIGERFTRAWSILYCNIGRARLSSLVALLLLAVLPVEGVGVDLCPCFLIFEVPCPACGLTRSVTALLHGQLGMSFAMHPLGSVALIFLVVCAITNRPDRLALRVRIPRRENTLNITTWLIASAALFLWLRQVV